MTRPASSVRYLDFMKKMTVRGPGSRCLASRCGSLKVV